LKNLFDGKEPKTESVWVPNITAEPKESANPLTPGVAKKAKPVDTTQSPEEQQKEAAKRQREAKQAKREDPIYQAELMKKMEERQRKQRGDAYSLGRKDVFRVLVKI
jgi:hypothetical protein